MNELNINSKIHDLCIQKLSSKVTSSTSDLLLEEGFWKRIANEIQTLINQYNKFKKTEIPDFEVYINAQQLLSIWENDLPDYLTIIETLINTDLKESVFGELANSGYFNDIWKIDNKTYLVANLCILFYRTSLLFLYPELREKKAQISSTLEEMACIAFLNGEKTFIYEASYCWIKNWEEEGFSKRLFELVNQKELVITAIE